jgi:hypothetical protein
LQWMEVRMCPKAGQDVVEKRKISFHVGIRTSIVQSVASNFIIFLLYALFSITSVSWLKGKLRVMLSEGHRWACTEYLVV